MQHVDVRGTRAWAIGAWSLFSEFLSEFYLANWLFVLRIVWPIRVGGIATDSALATRVVVACATRCQLLRLCGIVAAV